MVMKLSKNFSLEEMCRSNTASVRGLPNVPNAEQVKNLQHLCENVLQPLRDHLGKPVVINSGFRSQAVNMAVGGAKNSQHTKGEAADIKCKDYPYAKEIYTWIMDNLKFDQVILERKGKAVWVHVSFRTNGKNRQQALTIHNA
jgi:hypothetical protein